MRISRVNEGIYIYIYLPSDILVARVTLTLLPPPWQVPPSLVMMWCDVMMWWCDVRCNHVTVLCAGLLSECLAWHYWCPSHSLRPPEDGADGPNSPSSSSAKYCCLKRWIELNVTGEIWWSQKNGIDSLSNAFMTRIDFLASQCAVLWWSYLKLAIASWTKSGGSSDTFLYFPWSGLMGLIWDTWTPLFRPQCNVSFKNLIE